MNRTILLSITILLAAAPSPAYDNLKTHPAINTLAIQHLLAKARTDDSLAVFRNYDFSPVPVGQTSFRLASQEDNPLLDKTPRNALEWIADGGRTADVNYANGDMAFRHFYDPVAANPAGEGVHYLTDLADNPETTVVMMEFNPKITAKEWGLGTAGPAKRSPHWLGAYLDVVTKQRRVGDELKPMPLAWQSLGETLHLLADMTVPAHVRNDAHPGTPGTYKDAFETWRSDPYENYVTEAVVREYHDEKVEPGVLTAIQMATTPDELFDVVARHVNEHFISQDTISGRDPGNRVVTNANGCQPYPSPRIDREDYRDGFLVKTDYLGELKLAAIGWAAHTVAIPTSPAGPAPRADMPPARQPLISTEDAVTVWKTCLFAVTNECAMSQARRLVPLAIAAEVRLLELVLPQLTAGLSAVDLEKSQAAGSLVAIRNFDIPHRIYAHFIVDGTIHPHRLHLWVKPDGRFLADLPAGLFPPMPPDGKPRPVKLAMAFDLGGLLVKTDPLDVTPPAPPAPPAPEPPAGELAIAGPDTVVEGRVVQYSLRIPPAMKGKIAKVRWMTSMEAVPKFNEKDMAMLLPVRLSPKPGQADFAAPGEPMTYQGITNTAFLHRYRPGKPVRQCTIGAVAIDSTGRGVVAQVRKGVTLKVCPLVVTAFQPEEGWKLTAGENVLNLVKERQLRAAPPVGADARTATFAYAAGAAYVKASLSSDWRLLSANERWTAEQECQGLFRYVYDYGSLVPSSLPLDQSGWKGTLHELRTTGLPRQHGRFSGHTHAGYAYLDQGLIRRRIIYIVDVSGAKFSHDSGSIDDSGALTGAAADLQKEALKLIRSMKLEP